MLLAFCASAQVPGGEDLRRLEPYWWGAPKNDDQFNLYVKASSTGCWSEEAARQAAYDAALGQFAKRVAASVKVGDVDGRLTRIRSAVGLRNTKVEFEKTVMANGSWHSWALVAYPRDEADKLAALIDQSVREAEPLLKGLRAAMERHAYLRATRLVGELERLQFIGDGQLDQAHKLQAQIPVPIPQLDQLRERFEGKSLALLCYSQDDGQLFPYQAALVDRMNALHLKTVSLDTPERSDAAACAAAKARQADYLLVMKLKVQNDFKPAPASDHAVCLVGCQWQLFGASSGAALGGGALQTIWTASHPEAAKLAAIVGVNVLLNKKMAEAIQWPAGGE